MPYIRFHVKISFIKNFGTIKYILLPVLEDLSSFLKMEICWIFNRFKIILERNADTAYNGKLYFSIITHWYKKSTTFRTLLGSCSHATDEININYLLYTKKWENKNRKNQIWLIVTEVRHYLVPWTDRTGLHGYL